MTGLAYLHSMEGMAPGGGGGTPPPGKGGPPDDKGDDGSGEEENEEDDTDEETVSVTSSSQVSAPLDFLWRFCRNRIKKIHPYKNLKSALTKVFNSYI